MYVTRAATDRENSETAKERRDSMDGVLALSAEPENRGPAPRLQIAGGRPPWWWAGARSRDPGHVADSIPVGTLLFVTLAPCERRSECSRTRRQGSKQIGTEAVR
ncbi:hypothetical protein MTO96_014028 [Rhipicephalus appendiculatus]